MATIIFYTDKFGADAYPSDEDVDQIRAHFKACFVHYCNAKPVAGFESGVNWGELVARGAVAVVLYNINDACAFGVSLEASDAGLKVFEMFQGDLLELERLQVTGKKPVLNLQAK